MNVDNPIAPSNVATAPSNVSAVVNDSPLINQNYINVNSQVARVIEVLFSFVGACAFFSEWVYMTFMTTCFRRIEWLHTVTGVNLIGLACCLLTLFHTCLDNRIAIGRGIVGCFIFVQLVLVSAASFLVSYWAFRCICKCSSRGSIFEAKQLEDLVIFSLSLVGALCIVIILIMASIARG